MHLCTWANGARGAKAKSVCPRQQENLAAIKSIDLAEQSGKLISPERVGELLDACVHAGANDQGYS